MHELGARNLVLLGGIGKQEGDFKALALEYGIRTSYHNHTYHTGENFEDMEKLLSLTDPSKVSVMCDTGHATKDFLELPPGERAIQFLKKYENRITFIEYKDWNEETELSTPLGEGYCDYDSVFAWIRDSGYSGWITVE